MGGSVARALAEGAALLTDAKRGHGVAAIHRAHSSGAETPCSIVVDQALEPILRGGELVVEESHFSGSVTVSELPALAKGDTFHEPSTGRTFRVYLPPRTADGLHTFILRVEAGQ